MPSQAETAAARVATVLLAAGTNAGARVYRDREEAFGREESPSILSEILDDDAQSFSGGHHKDRAELRLAVTTLTRSAAWQSEVDAVRVQVHTALMADATLLGLMANLRRTRAEWRAASADLPLGYCAQQYSGQYLSNNHSLSA